VVFTGVLMEANVALQAGGEATCVSAEARLADAVQLGDGAVAVCVVAGIVRSEGSKGDDNGRLSGILGAFRKPVGVKPWLGHPKYIKIKCQVVRIFGLLKNAQNRG
jgi:hypothetical protein